MTTATLDPMAAAMSATDEPRDRTYFGEIVTADAWFVVLEKGVGKRLWDASRDDVNTRRTAIKIEIDPLRGEYLITQECLHFEQTWLKCTLPSLRALGADLGSLKGQFCQVKRVSTGETYVNKQGETKEKTGIVFIALYPDAESCVRAADEFYAHRGSTANGTPAESTPETDLSPEQAFALRSLPALWKASGSDPAKFKTLIDQNPLISKYYPWNHPHVQGLVRGDTSDLFPEADIPF